MKIQTLLCIIGALYVRGVVGSVGKYGNVGNLQPTGASSATARSDNLPYNGVRASNEMAGRDLNAMSKYRTIIQTAARQLKIDPAVIAAIISRESRAGKVLRNGWGDRRNAWGLMQIDKRHHRLEGEWNSLTHVLQGTRILIDGIVRVRNKFPSWSADRQLQGGIAAYNFGVGNVRSWNKLDVGTTNNDYSNDVVARAQYYRRNGYV